MNPEISLWIPLQRKIYKLNSVEGRILAPFKFLLKVKKFNNIAFKLTLQGGFMSTVHSNIAKSPKP
jgi:hypothetical protein